MKRMFLVVILTLSFSVGAEHQDRQMKPNLKEGRGSRSKAQIFSPFSLIRQKRPQRLPHNPVLQLEEFLLDTTCTFGPAPGDQEFAEVSFDGTNYFVVWHDWQKMRIYGARVSREGVLLDTFGIPICPNAVGQEYPAVAFDGTNYFVVWSDWRNGYYDIYGARVTPHGIVLDPDGIVIATGEYDKYVPSIAFDGTNYLVAWNDYRNGWEADIYAARVTTAGEVLDPDAIVISDAPYDQLIFRGIGFDGTNYLLVWHDDRDGDSYYDVYGARLTQAGIVLDTEGIAVSVAQNNQGFAQIGFDGTNYFVVWLDDRAQEEDYRIYGARVTTDGVVIDTNGIQIAQYLSTYPAVEFDSTSYLVVWTDIRSGYEADIYAARVTTAGAVLDPQGIPVSTAETDQWLPAMIFDGTGYFTVWADYRNEYEDIYGARVTTAGVVLDPDGILLDYGYSSPEQYAPAVAFDGTNYLVVWEDYRKGYAIYGARVTPEGSVLDPQGIPISADSLWRYAPAVAFDGTNYLVVWTDYRNGEADIYGARVTTAGVVLDPNGIPITTAENWQWSPAVAFDGTNYLVVWDDDRNGYESDIYAARVTPAGVVLDTSGITVSTAPNGQYTSAIGFDGTNYLIVWSDYRSGEYGDIYGARVTTAGSVLEPQGIRIATADNDQWSPRVAYDGTNYLVVFDDDRDGDRYLDVYGARVRPDGVVLDSEGIAISTAEFDQTGPRLAFDGINYLVVWADYRNEWSSDIYGARVTPAGAVLDPEGIELINQPDERFAPDIAKGSGSQLLLTFGGYVPLYGVNKVFGALYQGIGISEKGAGKSGFGLRVLTNPIRSNGMVELTLTKESEVKLELVDVTGRLVKTIATGRLSCGTHQIRLDCQSIQTGVYFLRCAAGEKSLITKVANIR